MDGVGAEAQTHGIIGRNPDLLEIMELIEKVAPTQAPVLINGESGTGNELIAMAIHPRSDRANKSFSSSFTLASSR